MNYVTCQQPTVFAPCPPMPVVVHDSVSCKDLDDAWHPTQIEMHVAADTRFAAKYGRAIKEAGGRYSACRGYSDVRYIHIPATPVGMKVLRRIVKASLNPDNPRVDCVFTQGKRGRVYASTKGMRRKHLVSPDKYQEHVADYRMKAAAQMNAALDQIEAMHVRQEIEG